jgi:dCTP deaminase
MVLSDLTIKEEVAAGRLVFDPYDESLVQPSSVDMRVDSAFRVFNNSRHPYIDVRKQMDDLTTLVRVEEGEPFVLHPGEFVLGQTLERVQLPNDLVARLEGKSSLGRLGLVIHSTAGFVDPGFEGNLTLELSNLANLPITIYEGMPIGQISFMRMDRPVEHAYGRSEAGSKYQGQTEPTASRYYLNFAQEGNGADPSKAREKT